VTRFRFELDLGGRTIVVYGYDHAVGYFVRIRKGKKVIADYDMFSDNYNGLQGLLRTLVAAGVFTAQETADAVNLVFQTDNVETLRDEDVGLAAMVVMRLTDKATR